MRADRPHVRERGSIARRSRMHTRRHEPCNCLHTRYRRRAYSREYCRQTLPRLAVPACSCSGMPPRMACGNGMPGNKDSLTRYEILPAADTPVAAADCRGSRRHFLHRGLRIHTSARRQRAGCHMARRKRRHSAPVAVPHQARQH